MKLTIFGLCFVVMILGFKLHDNQLRLDKLENNVRINTMINAIYFGQLTDHTETLARAVKNVSYVQDVLTEKLMGK